MTYLNLGFPWFRRKRGCSACVTAGPHRRRVYVVFRSFVFVPLWPVRVSTVFTCPKCGAEACESVSVPLKAFAWLLVVLLATVAVPTALVSWRKSFDTRTVVTIACVVAVVLAGLWWMALRGLRAARQKTLEERKAGATPFERDFENPVWVVLLFGLVPSIVVTLLATAFLPTATQNDETVYTLLTPRDVFDVMLALYFLMLWWPRAKRAERKVNVPVYSIALAFPIADFLSRVIGLNDFLFSLLLFAATAGGLFWLRRRLRAWIAKTTAVRETVESAIVRLRDARIDEIEAALEDLQEHMDTRAFQRRLKSIADVCAKLPSADVPMRLRFLVYFLGALGTKGKGAPDRVLRQIEHVAAEIWFVLGDEWVAVRRRSIRRIETRFVQLRELAPERKDSFRWEVRPFANAMSLAALTAGLFAVRWLWLENLQSSFCLAPLVLSAVCAACGLMASGHVAGFRDVYMGRETLWLYRNRPTRKRAAVFLQNLEEAIRRVAGSQKTAQREGAAGQEHSREEEPKEEEETQQGKDLT